LEPGSVRYTAYCGGRRLGAYPSLADALRALAGCGEDVVVERCEPVLRLTPQEYAELASRGPRPVAQPGEKPARAGEKSLDASPLAVVFDQMFRRFAEVLDRELPGESIVFHEVIGRGLEAPLRVGERIYQQPARDDYDVLKLLEQLSNQYRRVVFFTGDKKLAAQARALPGVYVVYLPPSEVAGKEMAIKLMKKEILSQLGRG